jgi:hypothetical protein
VELSGQETGSEIQLEISFLSHLLPPSKIFFPHFQSHSVTQKGENLHGLTLSHEVLKSPQILSKLLIP